MRLARVIGACVLIGMLALIPTSGLQSQDRKSSKVRGQLPAGWGKLNLSTAQKEEIYKLNKDYKDKIDKLEEEIKKLQDELAKKRVAVLTDEQRKKLLDSVSGGAPEKPKTKNPEK